jgi:CRISPR-associated endonuclease/helicase Cas3
MFSCSGALAPHHSRFARSDRGALDRALEARLGKERPDRGCIVVATQTVQQSLDIDADVLFTDLCPMDVLLQRIGRLHRHARRRPESFGTAQAFIVTPAERDLGLLLDANGVPRSHHGLGWVYPDLRQLEATWRLIEERSTWAIPEMNRELVERCVHSILLAQIANAGGARWQRHTQHVLGAVRGQDRQAELNLVDWSKPYSETSFANDERISSRLGQDDRRAVFAEPFAGPLGL